MRAIDLHDLLDPGVLSTLYHPLLNCHDPEASSCGQVLCNELLISESSHCSLNSESRGFDMRDVYKWKMQKLRREQAHCSTIKP